MEKFAALIVDIEKSRLYKIEERNKIQGYMDGCISLLNKLFENSLEFEVTFSAGDELQGLFSDVVSAVLYFRLLELLMKPVRLRAGIGIGEWTVKLKDGLSTQQDGPAYHRARQAIEEVYKMQLQNVRVCSENDCIMENHLLNASNVLKRQQIYMQNMVMCMVELLYPFQEENTLIYDRDVIIKLLEMKAKSDLGKYPYSVAGGNNSGKFAQEKVYEFERIKKIEPILIDGRLTEAEQHIWVKNTSAELSDILVCTRQNVDAVIKRGNINKIRELDYMALQYIKRTKGEDIWN